MARLTGDNGANKGKSVLNGVRDGIGKLSGSDSIKDSLETINEDVQKIKADTGTLAGNLRDTAADTVKRGQDYVQGGVASVKEQVAGKVSAVRDMPVRKALYGILALCAVSYFLGRRR